MKNVIVIGLVLILILMTGTEVMSQEAIKRKVDSLFVIASSGEVMFRDLVEPAQDSIAAMGAAAVPYLIEKFDTNSAREKWTVVFIIRKIGAAAVPALINALKYPDELIVQRVCFSLGEVGDSSAVEPLMAVTGHNDWQVRDESILSLGRIGDERAFGKVTAALEDTIGQVRKSAAVSCGRLKIEGSINKLAHCLGDDFYGARWMAADALTKLDTNRVIAVLADSVQSNAWLIGDLACWVLGEFGTDEAMLILRDQAHTDDPQRRAQAAVAMIKADPDDNCGFQKPLFENETDRLVKLKMESARYTYQNESK